MTLRRSASLALTPFGAHCATVVGRLSANGVRLSTCEASEGRSIWNGAGAPSSEDMEGGARSVQLHAGRHRCRLWVETHRGQLG